MKTYPDELKESIIKKLLPPNDAYIPQLSEETGIPKDTLYSWRIRRGFLNSQKLKELYLKLNPVSVGKSPTFFRQFKPAQG